MARARANPYQQSDDVIRAMPSFIKAKINDDKIQTEAFIEKIKYVIDLFVTHREFFLFAIEQPEAYHAFVNTHSGLKSFLDGFQNTFNDAAITWYADKSNLSSLSVAAFFNPKHKILIEALLKKIKQEYVDIIMMLNDEHVPLEESLHHLENFFCAFSDIAIYIHNNGLSVLDEAVDAWKKHLTLEDRIEMIVKDDEIFDQFDSKKIPADFLENLRQTVSFINPNISTYNRVVDELIFDQLSKLVSKGSPRNLKRKDVEDDSSSEDREENIQKKPKQDDDHSSKFGF